MKTLLFSNIFVVFLLSLCVGRGEAAFSRSMRCPCHHSLAAERWNSLSIEEAVRLSDVVLLGRVVDLHAGIRGTMNASLISIFTYKGPSSFLSRLEDVTNFAEDTREDLMALFFFAEEPSGNLALQCMSPLLELHSATLGDLKALLDFVRDLGRRESTRSLRSSSAERDAKKETNCCKNYFAMGLCGSRSFRCIKRRAVYYGRRSQLTLVVGWL